MVRGGNLEDSDKNSKNVIYVLKQFQENNRKYI